jgi:hypothetical protein
MVNGVPVQVYGTPDQGFAVVAGNQLIIQTRDYVSILGIFEGGGRTYVVLAENPGGSSGDVFQAIDMSTTRYSISPIFGTGAGGEKPEVVDGALVMTANSNDQKERFRYSFKDGKLEMTKQAINLQPSGPARAPGGDLAAFVNGKSMSEIFKARATASALQQIMDPNAFADARDVALQDIQGGPFVEADGIASAWACQSHDCAYHWVSIAFDHQGHAWALLVRRSVPTPTYYGSPDILVKRHLKPPG